MGVELVEWPRDFDEWLDVCWTTVNYEGMKRNNSEPRDPDRPLFKFSDVPDLDEASDEEIVEELLRRLRLRKEAADAVTGDLYDLAAQDEPPGEVREYDQVEQPDEGA